MNDLLPVAPVMPTEVASACLQITWMPTLAFARGRLCVGMTVKGRLLALVCALADASKRPVWSVST
jgi:hypothetical protein